MSPRPAPDLDRRREEIIHAARHLAETDGWPAVTMRRLAGELGVTQPVIYSAFASPRHSSTRWRSGASMSSPRRSLLLAPRRLSGAATSTLPTRTRGSMRMFLLPSGLPFATDHTRSARACVLGDPGGIPRRRRNQGRGRVVFATRPGDPAGERAPARESPPGPARAHRAHARPARDRLKRAPVCPGRLWQPIVGS